MPNEWMQDKKVMEEGKDQLIITTTGGHSIDCFSVYFSKEEVLIAGDLVQADHYPYFGDPTGNMESWINTLKKWETLPLKKIVPGHGKIVNKIYITTIKNYFNNLKETLIKLKKQKIFIREINNHPDLPKGYWDENLKRPTWWDYCIRLYYSKL